jgi:putative ABC transport system permease protein
MTTRWRKIYRDFEEQSPRALLAVLAIAVGLAGFSAVLSSYAILTRELNNGYLATNPASATLRVDDADDQLVAAVQSNRDVAVVEARRAISARVKSARGGWRNAMLFVVKDYSNIRVSKLVPQSGAWPPATGEILIERDAFQVARTRIGDTLAVKTLTGIERALRVSGSVHDVGKAQARMENIVYGYITLDTLALLGEEPRLNELNILVAKNRFDEGHIRKVVGAVQKQIESDGHRVLRADVPPPGKHPHAEIMGMLLLIMSSFGLFVMVLSGVIVINLLVAMMASQVRQIAVMKAIGATRAQVSRLYLAQALMMGAAAVAIALPLGIWGGRVLCRYMAVFLNFDINSFAVPVWVYALVAIVGFIIPLLAAAYPVMSAAGVSVREALADFGVSRNQFGATVFDRTVLRMRGPARPILLAIRNNFRRRARLALTVLTLTAGGLFFMAALNIRTSMIHTLDRLFASKQYDLGVTLNGMYPFSDVDRLIRKVPGVVRTEGWIATEAGFPGTKKARADTAAHSGGGGLHGGGELAGDRFPMVALPVPSTMVRQEIVQGRGLMPGDTDTLVINTALAAKSPAFLVGKRVTLPMGPAEVSLLIVGISREPFTPPLGYMPRAFFDRLEGHRGTANTIRVALARADSASIEKAKADLERNLVAGGMQPLSISSKADSRFGFDQHMLMIYVFLVVMAFMLAAVGGLGLATTMSISVLERRRELGILRAIGATPRMVWLLLVAEGTAIGLMSWILAALGAWPVSKALGDVLAEKVFHSGLDFTIDARGGAIWLATSLSLAAIASSIPAWHASRRPVSAALTYE